MSLLCTSSSPSRIHRFILKMVPSFFFRIFCIHCILCTYRSHLLHYVQAFPIFFSVLCRLLTSANSSFISGMRSLANLIGVLADLPRYSHRLALHPPASNTLIAFGNKGFVLISRLTQLSSAFMRFVFLRPEFCRRLPSDSTSRWTPLP